jgi:hypothetical protein
MTRVDPSSKGPKSVAEATLEDLSAMGGRVMATLRAPDGRADPIAVRNPG